MRKSVDDMLRELYVLDTENNYNFTFYGGTTWEVRNKITQEGLYTEGGFGKVKRWLLKNMEDKKKPKDYTECDCSKCKNTCIHKDAYRRLPTEIGGLGLCKNLKKK